METVIPRIFHPPRQSFFLFGPRGTGKTTWIRYTFPNAVWIDLLDPENYRMYSARPERLTEIVMAERDARVVVIDEVQRVPELLHVVHSLIEKKMKIQFILTGSSSRKLKRTGVDLLAGRAVKETLYPFMAIELGKLFDLERAVQYGLIPLVFSAHEPVQVLKTYAALYVREEVQMEGLVRNVGNFSRFLETISFSHGSVLNISNVARECEVERKVVEGYVSILEDLLLSFRIPIFSKRAQRALVTHPKFYFVDTGLFRSLRPRGPLDRPGEIEGPALEGLVAQHLMAWCGYRDDTHTVYFWRTQKGSEVDFVVYGDKVFWAIEVKNTARVRPEDVVSLKAFKEDYPESKVVLLYRGKTRMKKGNVMCIPCEEFLLRLDPHITTLY